MNDSRLDKAISAKKAEIQLQLEDWVRRESLLGAGQQISFSISIRSVPVVTEGPAVDVMDMTLTEMFSPENIRAAGFDPKAVAARMHNGLCNSLGLKDRTATVSDLVNYQGRFCWKSVGPKTWQVMQKILDNHGIHDVRVLKSHSGF